MSKEKTTQEAASPQAAGQQPHMSNVRQHLLDTLADLRNREAPMDVGRAKAVAHVASVLIESAKVEVDFLRITKQQDSTFLALPGDTAAAAPMKAVQGAHNPFGQAGVRRNLGFSGGGDEG